MLGGLQKTSIHHYNKGSSTSASKSDFSENGAISNDIDFMIYIGHGHNAHNELGNHLHYDCGILGTPHVKNDDGTYSYCNPDGNAYTSEMRFGSGTSALRWVWLYTCNFLAINEYVSNYSLMEMMTGAHIVMGYETQAYLCDAMVTKFAEYLSTGESIIRAYFKAGTDGEATATEDHHIMKIIFIRQAQNETIYSPAIHYEYDITDIMIITHDIQENFE